jgi:hypothetical protein
LEEVAVIRGQDRKNNLKFMFVKIPVTVIDGRFLPAGLNRMIPCVRLRESIK